MRYWLRGIGPRPYPSKRVTQWECVRADLLRVEDLGANIRPVMLLRITSVVFGPFAVTKLE